MPTLNALLIFICRVIAFLTLLAVLLLLSLFSYLWYRLLVLTAGVLVLYFLRLLWKRKRSTSSRYTLAALMCIVIAGVGFLTIPEFNFLLTSSARQQIVNNFIATYHSDQNDLPIQGSSITGKGIGTISGNYVAVYFRYNPGYGNPIGSRAFIVYTTDPARTKKAQFDENLTWRELKDKWYYMVAGALRD